MGKRAKKTTPILFSQTLFFLLLALEVIISLPLSSGVPIDFEAFRRADGKEAAKAKITVMCPIMLFTNRHLSLDSVQ